MISLPQAPEGWEWSQVAQAANLSEAYSIFPAYEQSSMQEGEQSVLTFDLPTDWFAGAIAGTVGLLHSTLSLAGVQMWGQTEAIGNTVYIYGATAMPWLAVAIGVLLALFVGSLVATAISLWQLVSKVVGIAPFMTPVLLMVAVFIGAKILFAPRY